MRSTSDDAEPTWSRRAVLAGLGGFSAGAVTGPVRAAGTGSTGHRRGAGTTVATWNCYLGVDLFRLFDADSLSEVRSLAGDLLADARGHPYAARADAIADQLLSVGADVIALQEAALVRARPTFDEDAETETVADLLALVTDALAARDASYEVVTTQVTTDVAVPAAVDGDWVTVRLTDRVALLVREGVEVRETRSGRYDARARFEVLGDDLVVTLRRGYCLADLAVAGEPLTVCSTHLESAKAAVRRKQATELLDVLPDEGTVVVGADLNSGPSRNRRAYETVTGSLSDAAATTGSPGDTCCQPADLRNEDSRLASRVDQILARGAPDPTAVQRLGEASEDRVQATVDGESVTVWPSDHAGVAATYPIPDPTATPSPTPSPTASPTPSPTPSPTARPTPLTTESPPESPSDHSGTTDGTGAGVGVLGALAALVGGALARRGGRD
mgnify:CR=1 FL=1